MKNTNMNTKHTRSHRCILLGVLGLVALCVPKISAAAPVLENVEWVLIELNGKAVKAPEKWKTRGATLKLDAKEKRAHGVSFVNQYGARYDLKDNTLRFAGGMMTAMGGSNREEVQAETDYHDMLKGVSGWRITDGKLELLAAEKVVARFAEKVEPKK